MKLKCSWKNNIDSKISTDVNSCVVYIEGINIQGALLQTTNNEINLVKVKEDSPDHSESPILELMYVQQSKEDSTTSFSKHVNPIGLSVINLPLYSDSSRQNLVLHIPSQCKFGEKNTWKSEADLLLSSVALYIEG